MVRCSRFRYFPAHRIAETPSWIVLIFRVLAVIGHTSYQFGDRVNGANLPCLEQFGSNCRSKVNRRLLLFAIECSIEQQQLTTFLVAPGTPRLEIFPQLIEGDVTVPPLPCAANLPFVWKFSPYASGAPRHKDV
jgi:hypothetical protein